MKTLFICIMLALATASFAQEKQNGQGNYTIYGKDYEINGYVKDGKIYDRSYNVKGYIKDNQIYDRSYNTRDYYDSKGNSHSYGSGGGRGSRGK